MRYAVAGLLLTALALLGRAEDKSKKYDVEVVKGVRYFEKDADDVRHKLDLYLPKGAKDSPVLFFVHGGGWTKGSKDGFAAHGRTFASNGIAFVAINYRLSPKVKHPDHIKDTAK